jgi:hypothetical protein
MALHQFKKGELAYWLGVIAENGMGRTGPVPQAFVDALVTLRCIEIDAAGTPVITDKGRLALRMESQDLHSGS